MPCDLSLMNPSFKFTGSEEKAGLPPIYDQSGTYTGSYSLDQNYGGTPMTMTGSNQSMNSNSTGFTSSSGLAYSTHGSPFETSYMDPPSYTNLHNGRPHRDHEFNLNFQGASIDKYSLAGDQPPGVQKCTPSSLGWTADMENVALYRLILSKGKEPYLELRPQHPKTEMTPEVVYLDDPPNSNKKTVFPCMFPTNCMGKNGQQASFQRPADLERHYKHVHSSDDLKDVHFCTYPKCARYTTPFARKDHYRDHLRDFHKEDIGHAKKSTKNITKYGKKEADRRWQEEQRTWLAERNISEKHWRCARCLTKVSVADHEWTCSACHNRCEQERIDMRMKMPVEVEVPVEVDGYAPNPYECFYCNGTQWVGNEQTEWEACPHCRPISTWST